MKCRKHKIRRIKIPTPRGSDDPGLFPNGQTRHEKTRPECFGSGPSRRGMNPQGTERRSLRADRAGGECRNLTQIQNFKRSPARKRNRFLNFKNYTPLFFPYNVFPACSAGTLYAPMSEMHFRHVFPPYKSKFALLINPISATTYADSMPGV